MKRKKIQLDHYTAPDKTSTRTIRKKNYKVTLFWNHSKYFTNKKQVIAYLAESSRFLNERYNDLNFILVDVFFIYRTIWPYIDRKTECSVFNRDFLNVFSLMDNWCNNFGIQGNFNAFDKLQKSIDELRRILDQIHTMQKGQVINPALIKSLENRLTALQDQISIFLKS